MSGEQQRKESAASRETRAASVTEHLRAAKAELLSAAPEPLPEQAVSLKPLFIGIGVIVLGALAWMLLPGAEAPVATGPAPVVQQDREPRASPALEAAREARERVRAAEESARLARERRAALETEQAAQRAREAEQARRDAEEQAAALAAARESTQREALEARQADARREAAARAARAEQARQAALAAQREQEREAALAVQREREAEAQREADAQVILERATAGAPVAEESRSPEPVPVVQTEGAHAQTGAQDPVEAFRQARPGEVRTGPVAGEGDVEFSADPCKGPSARFLSTCR